MSDSKKKFLCVLFHVTSGVNKNDHLGCDESEIVFWSSLIIDTSEANKVYATNYQFTRPRLADVKVDFLTDECKSETELNEAYFYNAKYLEVVLEEFDSFLKTHEVHPDSNNCDLTLVTDGSLHLRQCLIPECSKKSIKLSQYFYSYIDLRKEFCKFNGIEKCSGIESMLEYFLLPQNTDTNYAIRNSLNMHGIISQMLNNGCKFDEPEEIMQVMNPGIWFISIDDDIEDDTIVKARGLPWQCSEQDVFKFFRGLNISKGGIALCLSSQGRRNGEALVRFVSEEMRDLALLRHKHHIGQRYIEVYRATGRDFLNIAGGTNSEAQAFLSRDGQVIVRMRGLPFDANSKEVVDFFENGNNSTQIVDGEAGVLFVKYPDGRATGDAFVMFKLEEEASRALLKHKETMGSRYIELFRSTTAEVQQVFKRSQDPKHYQNAIKDIPFTAPPLPILPPEMLSGTNRRDCIRVRGLPLDCSVETILEFLGTHRHHIVPQGVHMIYNAQGQPSGEAFIQMNGELSAFQTSSHKNNKYIFFSGKKYYIEVIQCSGEEMNLVLMGIVPSNLLAQTAKQPSSIPSLLPNPLSTYTSQNSSTTALYPASATSLSLNPVTASTTSLANLNSITSSSHFYPQFVYWYQPPTPPVSPSSTLYIHPSSLMHASTTAAPSPCMIVLRGVPQTVTLNDVLQFLHGFPEVSAEAIQIQHGLDGRPNGDVWVSFYNRSEAERAIIEKNHQMIGNRLVEIYLAI